MCFPLTKLLTTQNQDSEEKALKLLLHRINRVLKFDTLILQVYSHFQFPNK